MEQVNTVLGAFFIYQTYVYDFKTTCLIFLLVAPYVRMIYFCYIKKRSIKESLLDITGYTHYFDEESIKKGFGERSYLLNVMMKYFSFCLKITTIRDNGSNLTYV